MVELAYYDDDGDGRFETLEFPDPILSAGECSQGSACEVGGESRGHDESRGRLLGIARSPPARQRDAESGLH